MRNPPADTVAIGVINHVLWHWQNQRSRKTVICTVRNVASRTVVKHTTHNRCRCHTMNLMFSESLMCWKDCARTLPFVTACTIVLNFPNRGKLWDALVMCIATRIWFIYLATNSLYCLLVCPLDHMFVDISGIKLID